MIFIVYELDLNIEYKKGDCNFVARYKSLFALKSLPFINWRFDF